MPHDDRRIFACAFALLGCLFGLIGGLLALFGEPAGGLLVQAAAFLLGALLIWPGVPGLVLALLMAVHLSS